jgi:DNA-binding transcriptional LysR family regulator
MVNLMDMRLDLADVTDLRLFLATVRAGSITRGAAEANLSLAAASERLRNLEARIGVTLLERGPRGVTPTEAGDVLTHHARLVLRQLAHLHAELSARATGARARIRLMGNSAAVSEFLPDRLGAWLAEHPQVDVELQERQSADIVDAVAGGRADVGVISEAVDTRDLELRPFAVDRLVVVASADHPVGAERRAAFAELLHLRFVGLAGGALQDHLEARAVRAGRPLLVRTRVRTFDAVCRLAARGAGLGVVPATAARRCRRAMRLSVVRLTDGWATRRLALCTPPGAALTPVARELVAHLIGRA